MNDCKIEIGDKVIGGNEVFVIAEIGKNFIQTEEEKSVQENLDLAIELVDKAIAAEVDAVKFQTHVLDDEIVDVNYTSPHFKLQDRYTWVKRNYLATPYNEFWKPLKSYCDQKGMLFFSTPMSKKSAILLEGLDVPLWKIGSGDVQDFVMLDYIASTNKPVIISTGMISHEELDNILSVYQSKNITTIVLYCVSQYPCPQEFFNLSSIKYIKEKYPEIIVGFSDHSVDGHDVVLAAIDMGAKVIEKHFSTSRNHWGSDHKASILPHEMHEMVDAIRNRNQDNIQLSDYYGTEDRQFEGASNQFRPFFMKTLVSGRDLNAGEILTENMIWAMRPTYLLEGIPSNEFYTILGKKLKKPLKKYQPIQFSDIDMG